MLWKQNQSNVRYLSNHSRNVFKMEELEIIGLVSSPSVWLQNITRQWSLRTFSTSLQMEKLGLKIISRNVS